MVLIKDHMDVRGGLSTDSDRLIKRVRRKYSVTLSADSADAASHVLRVLYKSAVQKGCAGRYATIK